ncbi:MAG: M48 family metallopeptidase [Zoogloeaceae bacterium]|jgi:Zn-dependent protease with chaperone function|nr:M48 family metallopeptidase [Zoogloeaceae bacterium]
MDFFNAQIKARRNTRWLVLWFALAVCVIILVIYLGVILLVVPQAHFSGIGVTAMGTRMEDMAYKVAQTDFTSWARFLNWEYLIWTTLLVGGTIAGASLWKIFQLSRMGGALIASELGGRLLARATTVAAERRLLNVVDEMSIAAGIPTPKVFVLDAEKSLNAFAAGTGPTNNVVAVTSGLLNRCDRDQLQGVIGHEIGHIVSGDARLNLRLFGVLFGILFLTSIGRALLRGKSRGRSSSKAQGVAILLGMILVVVGSIGVFFGKIIKAAISREREYLADAFSVQFTRNPNGLAGALRMMGGFGTRLEHPRAEEASHLFFGEGVRRFPLFSGLFATHPPIEKRIARIENIPLAKVRESAVRAARAAKGAAEQPGGSGSNFLDIGLDAPAQLAYAQAFIADLPTEPGTDVHTPKGALAAVYALLFAETEAAETQKKQLAIITATYDSTLAKNVCDCAAWLTQRGPRSRLPLLDLALPVLGGFTDEEKRRCMQCANALVRADGRISLLELAQVHILKSALGLPRKRHGLQMERLATDVSCLLALLAHAGNPNDDAAVQTAYLHALKLTSFADVPFPERSKLSPETIDRALDRIAQAMPRFRQRFLSACVAAVQHDGKITLAESELLRAFTQSLDCPAPPLLPDAP